MVYVTFKKGGNLVYCQLEFRLEKRNSSWNWEASRRKSSSSRRKSSSSVRHF